MSFAPLSITEGQSYKPLKPGQGRKVSNIWQIYTDLDKRWWEFRKRMMRNFNYVANEQISPEVLQMLKKQKRPALVDNLLHPLITFGSGMVSQNRTKVRALPVRNGDQNKAELHTILNEWAMQGCDGDYEIFKAASDAMIGGIGWVNVRWDFKIDPEGKPIIEEFDPFMVMFDPDGRKPDQSDWRYYTVSGWYGADEILTIFNGIDPEVQVLMRKRADELEGIYRKRNESSRPIGWEERIMAGMLDNWRNERPSGWGRDRILLDDMTDTRDGLYRVIEFHDRRTITKIDLYDPQNRKVNTIPSEFANVPEGLTGQARQEKVRQNQDYINGEMAKMGSPLKRTSQGDELWITAICPALLPEQPMLEVPYVVQGRGFQHKPIFAYDYHPDVTRTQSLIDNLISIQDSHNQRRMTQLELFMEAVNASYIAAEGSIAPKDIDTWQSRERGNIKFYQGGQPPQREFPAPWAVQGLGEFAAEDTQLLPQASGIPPNAMGFQQSSREGAMLYNQRVTAGLTILQVILGHLNRSLEQIFSYTDGLIQHFMTMERSVRLLGEPPDGMEGVEMDQNQTDMTWLKVNYQTLFGVLNDVSQGEYDFKPDPAKLGETTRRQLWYELVELWKIVPEPRRDWAVFFDAWDNPIGKKLAVKSRQVDKQMAEIGAAQQQIQQAGAQAKIGETQASAQKKVADAQAKQAQAKLKGVSQAFEIAKEMFPVNAGVTQ